MSARTRNPNVPRKLICENRHRWWRGVQKNLQPGDPCLTCSQPLIEDDDCTGRGDCAAEHHTHGCYADKGVCDAPSEHFATRGMKDDTTGGRE